MFFRRFVESLPHPVPNMDRWVVGVKGAAGARAFEICVHLESNEHAVRSYGWFGPDKLLISHNGGPCDWPVTQQVWDKLIRIAHETANELNASSVSVLREAPPQKP